MVKLSANDRGSILFWVDVRAGALTSLAKELIADVARSRRQPDAARFMPGCPIYFSLVANGEMTGSFLRDEYRIAHLPSRFGVLGLDLFPEL